MSSIVKTEHRTVLLGFGSSIALHTYIAGSFLPRIACSVSSWGYLSNHALTHNHAVVDVSILQVPALCCKMQALPG